ncbi:MAG TPA: hypothetical protein VFZ72_06590 [Jiangellaceae bacterium]
MSDKHWGDSAFWPPLLLAIDRSGRLLLGGVGLLAPAGRSTSTCTDQERVRSCLGEAIDAAVGLGIAVERRVFDSVAAVTVVVEAASAVLLRVVVIGGDVTGLRPWAEQWAERGRAEQRHNKQAAASALRAASAAVVNPIIDEIDFDAVLARVDIDAVLGGIDVSALARRVLDEIDLGQLVRESSTTMAAETADAVRARSMRADRALNRLVDHVLRRSEQRQTSLTEIPSGLLSEPDALA